MILSAALSAALSLGLFAPPQNTTPAAPQEGPPVRPGSAVPA